MVAIKVRHPGVATTILRDFETMLWVASWTRGVKALESLRLEDTLKQFAAPLKEQVGSWHGHGQGMGVHAGGGPVPALGPLRPAPALERPAPLQLGNGKLGRDIVTVFCQL